MKLPQTLITAFILFVTSSLDAQTPDYLQNDSKWRINFVGISFTTPCWIYEQYVCEITGDSVIGPYTYKKIIHHGLYHEMAQNPSPISPPCNPDLPFSAPYALIRQEGLKMYIYEPNQHVDTLLYDFDLQVGDFIPLSYNNLHTDVVVNSISTITVGSETRKVFHIENLGDPGYPITELIEGIGHNWGFIGTMQPFEFYESELVCFAINDVAYYPSMGAPCDLNVGIEEPILSNDMKLFPNPVENTLNIQLENTTEISEIQLIDITGNVQSLRFQNLSNDLILVNLGESTSGIYIIKIINKDKTSRVKRFIVN